MKKTLFILATTVLLISCHWRAALADNFDFVVLTDTTHDSDLPPEVKERLANNKERQKRLRERDAARDKHLKKLRRIVGDTNTKGFAVVDDVDLSDYDNIAARSRQKRRRSPIRYGYNKANLDTPAFAEGRMVAEYPLHEDEGITHQMLYVFEFDDLGTVVIDELSYTTIPDARIVVDKPSGNLHINGYPATFTAMTNQDGTKGMSGIVFYTENKLIAVTALRCITRDDKQAFEHLVQVASSLY